MPQSSNPFDQFDKPKAEANPFDQFDKPKAEANPFDQFDKPSNNEQDTLAAGARGFIRGIIPAAAGLAGGAVGAAGGAAVGGPVGAVAGGLAGGFGGAISAAEGQQKVGNWAGEHIPGVKSASEYLGLTDEQAAKDQAKHPVAQFAGQVLPYAMGAKPGLPSVKGALAGAGVGAGIQGAQEVMQGNKPDASMAARVGIGGLLGGGLAGPRGESGAAPKGAPATTIPGAETPQSYATAESVGDEAALNPPKDTLFAKPSKPDVISGPQGSHAPAELPEEAEAPSRPATPAEVNAVSNLHADKTMRQVGNLINTARGTPHEVPFEDMRYIIGPDGKTHWGDSRTWDHNAMADAAGYTGKDKEAVVGGKLTPEEFNQARAKYQTTEEFNDYLKRDALPGNMNKGDLGAAGVPKEPQRPVNIEDVRQVDWDRYEMAGRHHANFVEAINDLGKRPQEMIVAEPTLSQIAEGDPHVVATPYEQRLAAEVLPKYKETAYDLWKARTDAYAKADYPKEVVDALRQQNNPNYFPRISEQYVKEMSGLAGQLEADPASSAGGAGYQGRGRGTYEAGSEHGRKYFALENANGERKLVHLNRTNLEEVNGSKTYSVGDEPPLTNVTTVKDSKGGEWLVKDAYVREIEAATPERYIKDASYAYKMNEIALQRSLDEASYAVTKKAEMIEQGWATSNKALGRKNGWVQTTFPGLSNTYIEPRLARALDRYPSFKPGDDVTEWLAGANHWLTRSMFANPLPHMENTLEMYAMDFKLSSPFTLVEAIRDVRQGKPQFLQAVREGMPSWTSADAVRKFWKGGQAEIQELEKMPQTANIAMRLGMKPVELVRGIYDYSHAAMSNVQDVLMWSRTKDYLRKGMPMKEAVQEAIKSMPSYRTATEQPIGQDMMGGMSETAAKVANLPAKIQDSQPGKFAFNFTRYYGNTAANSIGRPVRMMLEAYKGVKLHGTDTAGSKAAFGAAKRDFFRTAANLFAYAVIMPYVADKAVQKMTGDQRSRATRWGTMAVWQAIDDVIHHRSTASEITRLLAFSPSPALGMAWDVVGYATGQAMNYGKTAQQAGSRHETAAQLGEKLLDNLPLYSLYGRMLPKSGVNKKPDTWGETAAKLTLGEHKTPRPDRPFVKPPPSLRIR